MLDTNIISDLIGNKRIARVGENNICTSIIVAAELRYGCAKSGSERLLKAVEDLLGEIDVLPLDVPADAEYGGLRAEREAGRQTDWRKRSADRRTCLCDRCNDRDRQYG